MRRLLESRLKWPAVLGAVIAVLALVGNASAGVSTDKQNYGPGDTVQITGDGMASGETVGVDVDYPDGSLAQHHDVTASGDGLFNDTYVVQATDPPGIYTVVATGQTSGHVFTTTFDPAVPGCTVDAPTFTLVTATSLTVNWNSTCFNVPSDSGNVFRILRRTPPGSGSYSVVGAVPVSNTNGDNTNTAYSFADTGLTCGSTQYEYLIEAFRPSPGLTKDSDPAMATTSPCVVAEAPTVGTTVLLNTDPLTEVPAAGANLGSQVVDVAEVTTTTNDIPSGSSVSFTLYRGPFTGDCTTGTAITGFTSTLRSGGTSKDESWLSSASSALGAGSYAFRATFTSGAPSTVANATGACEPFTVNKADTTTATQVHDDTLGVDVPLNGFVYVNDAVHDNATITTRVDPFDIGGTVDYNYYANGGCTGTPVTDADKAVTNGLGANSFTKTPLTLGSYCFNAHYDGDQNYKGSTSSNEPFTVVPRSAVTDSSLCPFDRAPDVPGSQFNLIYTPDVNAPTYKLNASNPGQFYYNVFYIGTGPAIIPINIPAPFVTQGAVPVHVYSGVSFGPGGCFVPGTEIAHSTSSIAGTNGGVLNVSVPGGFAYITIHLDYGYKGFDSCTKDANLLKASCTSPSSATIGNLTGYTFTAPAVGGSNTVSNENIFKKDPGIGGLITYQSTGNPVVNTAVKIYDSSNKLLATVYTDQDGWYMWAYKYTGKAATFTVNAVSKNQTVTLKSNGYLIVNFTA